jgi:2-phosphoglycerate kinase
LITENAFDKINEILDEFHKRSETATNLVSLAEKHKIVSIKSSLFNFLLREELKIYHYGRPEYLRDFQMVSNLVERKRNIMVLLGGTSGTGKSTLASFLASKLGISTVLSTDSIRHIMRNFMDRE